MMDNMPISLIGKLYGRENPLEGKSLILFDIDSTLADMNTAALLPGVAGWFIANHHRYELALITNQGGVGLRYWMERDGWGEPDVYPTEDEAINHIETVIENLKSAVTDAVLTLPYYVCFRYQTKKSGRWSPTPTNRWGENCWSTDWRKPNPGMLRQALADHDLPPDLALMVGDGNEDELAAIRAGVDFIHADQFFNRST